MIYIPVFKCRVGVNIVSPSLTTVSYGYYNIRRTFSKLENDNPRHMCREFSSYTLRRTGACEHVDGIIRRLISSVYRTEALTECRRQRTARLFFGRGTFSGVQSNRVARNRPDGNYIPRDIVKHIVRRMACEHCFLRGRAYLPLKFGHNEREKKEEKKNSRPQKSAFSRRNYWVRVYSNNARVSINDE